MLVLKAIAGIFVHGSGGFAVAVGRNHQRQRIEAEFGGVLDNFSLLFYYKLNYTTLFISTYLSFTPPTI